MRKVTINTCKYIFLIACLSLASTASAQVYDENGNPVDAQSLKGQTVTFADGEIGIAFTSGVGFGEWTVMGSDFERFEDELIECAENERPIASGTICRGHLLGFSGCGPVSGKPSPRVNLGEVCGYLYSLFRLTVGH